MYILFYSILICSLLILIFFTNSKNTNGLFQGFKNLRKRLFVILFKQKPMTYGAIYLLLIPIFAMFFSLLSNDFYYSTSKYETEYLDRLLNKISIEINSCLHNYEYMKGFIDQSYVPYKPPEYKDGKFYFSYKSIEYFSFKDPPKGRIVSNLGIKLERNFDQYFKNDSNYCFLRFGSDSSKEFILITEYHLPSVIITIEPQVNRKFNDFNWGSKIENDFTYFTDPSVWHEVYSLSNDNSSMRLIESIISENYGKELVKGEKIKFKYKTDIFHDSLMKEIVLPSRTKEKLNLYKQTIEGKPASFLDNYWRMLYCSSITITTLGYGDIVPITNKARTLISLESILGVVVIGLFLNALSKRQD